MKYLALSLLAAGLLVALARSHAEEADLEGRTGLMSAIERALASGELSAAESAMAEFRLRYPASSRVKSWDNGNEVVYLYTVVSRLAEAHAAKGNFDRVLEIYEDEIRGLSMDVPHYSWRFVALSVPYYLETGTRTPAELRQRLEDHRSRFAAMKRQVEHPGRKDLFASLEARMEAAAHHLALIGEPAPEFNFTRAFNADPRLELASLRGKVVLIDFWATWCAPCMAAWPELAELYDRWQSRGFEILSVTSLQGSFGPEKGLTPEREIELTAEFIEKHGVRWPVLFSDRSVNDPEYGAVTLPTYAVVDRQGRVHRILVGELGPILRTTLKRLLAE